MAGSDDAALEPSTRLARQVQSEGEAIGLPWIAVSPDISSPDPMLGVGGKPLAETVFRWVAPSVRYWKTRDFALRSPFCRAIRAIAEPFYVEDGRASTWRPSRVLDAVNELGPIRSPGVEYAIVAPAHLPPGHIGAVVWAAAGDVPIRDLFIEHAESLHALALRFIASYHEATEPPGEAARCNLTRREVQCLKCAAAGKTDADIARTMGISIPTVRFHITNAWKKLHATGRAQAIYRAATLGYLGGTAPR